MDSAGRAEPRVVVGVDDSPASRWALAWAIEAARLQRMPLLVAHISRLPAYPFPEALPAHHPLLADERRRGRALIIRLFEDVAGALPADVVVRTAVELGEPGPRLVSLTRPGDILVIGRRSRRGRGRRGWFSLISTRR